MKEEGSLGHAGPFRHFVDAGLTVALPNEELGCRLKELFLQVGLEPGEGDKVVAGGPMRGFAQSLNISVAAAMALRPVAERARLELEEAALLAPAAREVLWQEWVVRDEAMKKGAVAISELQLEPQLRKSP